MFRSLLILSCFTTISVFADTTEIKRLEIGTIPNEALMILGEEEVAPVSATIQVAADTKKAQDEFLNNASPGTNL